MHGMKGGGGVTRIGPTQTWEVWTFNLFLSLSAFYTILSLNFQERLLLLLTIMNVLNDSSEIIVLCQIIRGNTVFV